jgi:NAD(P)-dependent dehydrogenase (short-subunit alcohol dehydrogenase family)
MTGRFEGRVAVITGAASGIGEAGARLVVAEGGKVVIADYGTERGTKVASDLGDAALFVKCDVTVESTVADAFDAAIDTWGRCDAAWANAGIVGHIAPIAETDMEQLDRTIAVLLSGAFCTFKHAARVMLPAGNGGSMLGTASIAALKGGLGPHAYATAKAGVIALCRNLASELAPHRIRVNSIAPGGIPTAMTAHIGGNDPEELGPATKRVAKDSPLGRAGSVTDIAETAMFLLSDAGSYISAQNIVVDAGSTDTVRDTGMFEGSRMVVAREAD